MINRNGTDGKIKFKATHNSVIKVIPYCIHCGKELTENELVKTIDKQITLLIYECDSCENRCYFTW